MGKSEILCGKKIGENLKMPYFTTILKSCFVINIYSFRTNMNIFSYIADQENRLLCLNINSNIIKEVREL